MKVGRFEFKRLNKKQFFWFINFFLNFQDGQVHEMGNHDELMAKKGLYFNLVLAQKRRDESVNKQNGQNEWVIKTLSSNNNLII
jgi:hypothetical protein